MKIYYSLDDFQRLPVAIVTSGTFDGVHIGHQTILKRLKEVAIRMKGETVVITYWPHPRLVLKPEDQEIRLLNTFEEKAALLKQNGVDHLIRIPFTREFSSLSSQEFISGILINTIGTKKLVIGYDHRFGKNREGSFEQLKINAHSYGFEVEEIPRQDVDHVGVSSSKIRKALQEGDIETASHFLGKPYSLTGRVVKGDRLGRVLGFPTANLALDFPYKLVPSEGIYVVTVDHATCQYGGMLYIGNRPTVDGTKQVIEVNIFDFTQEIYGEALEVKFIRLLRGDVRFKDLEALKEQLQKDKTAAQSVLNQLQLP